MKARNCNDYFKCSISTKCYPGYSPHGFPSWVLPVGVLALTPLSSSCGGCAATHHTAALGNSSCIIQDNCGSCNPVLVLSLRVEFQYRTTMLDHVFPSTIFQYSK